MTVLILGAHDDAHAAAALRALDELGHDVELIDSRWFPSDVRLTLDARGGWHVGLPTGRVLRPGDVRSVYWCRYHGVGLADLPDEEQAELAANDARGLFEAMLAGLPARWFNGWQAHLSLQSRARLTEAATAAGLTVPTTLITNDAAAVRAFAAAHPGCTFEPVQGGRPVPLRPEHLSDEAIRRLDVAPVLLREPVDGVEVVAYVAGGRMMASEAVGDRMTPHVLSAEVAAPTARLARALGLTWAAVTFRRVGDRYVFLGADLSPAFLDIESRGGPPLLDVLVELLTEVRS